MARVLQLRKGTTQENNIFYGSEAELTYDVEAKDIRIHDANHRGGYVIPSIIETRVPTSSNNYTWFRKYSDGWVEQGGENAQAGTAIELPVKMQDTHYYASCISENATDTAATEMHLKTRTTNTVLFTCSYNGNSNYTSERLTWEVKGRYSQST